MKSLLLAGHGPFEQLTPRQREILALMAAGYRNREIAQDLVITEATVVNHIHGIFRRLGVSSRTQAVIYVLSTAQPGTAEKGGSPSL